MLTVEVFSIYAHSNAHSPVFFFLENRFSIVLMVYMLFGRIHRVCPQKHIFHIFSGVTYTDEFMFPLTVCTCTADITHALGFIRWSSSKCRVLYCIVYHGRFLIISICW